MELESLTRFGSFFHFLRTKSANFKECYTFSGENCCYYYHLLNVNSKHAVKLAHKTCEIVLLRCIPQFLDKIESWLESLNMPLSTEYVISYTSM